MSDLEAEGEADKFEGKVRKIVGTVTDDRAEEARGEAQIQKGKVKKVVGEAIRED